MAYPYPPSAGSGSAQHPSFADSYRFEGLITSMTVSNILHLITETNHTLGTRMKSTTGLKASIVSRVLSQINEWIRIQDVSSYNRFKTLLSRYLPGRVGANIEPSGAAAYPSQSIVSSSAYAGSSANGWDHISNYHSQPAASSSQYPITGGLAASRPAPSSYAPPPKKAPSVNWKESPLFKVVQPISDLTAVKESQHAQDRQAVTFSFVMSEAVRSMVNANPDNYSLRLFCTSSTYQSSVGPTNLGLAGLPMEFPQASEVRVNQFLIAASLKGLKKKPGSCPPADLRRGKGGEAQLLKMGSGQRNTIELVHVNQQGAQNIRKYFLQVCLVQSFSSDALVKKIQAEPLRTAQEVITAFIKKQAAEEDEIEAGAFTLNLKCPLSYVRMSTPVRSKICDHLQCFEASSWFQINEQTPQWACPVCERVLTIDQLFVDGYTDGIIKDCPDSVDDVLVEPNGDWHTTDKKYGTPSWLASNPLGPPAVPIVKEPTPNDDGENGNAKPTAIFTLSSDDEDGGRASAGPNAAVSRPSSSLAPQDHGAGGGGKGKGREVQQEPIDLTLSSDEEDDASPQPSAPRLSGGSQPNPLKRNATDAGSLSGSEGPEKKGRLGEYASPPLSSSSYPTYNNSDPHLHNYPQSLPPAVNNPDSSANVNHRFHHRHSYEGLRGGASGSSGFSGPGFGEHSPPWFRRNRGGEGEGEGGAGVAAAGTTASVAAAAATSPIVEPQPQQSTPRASSSTPVAESANQSRSRANSYGRLNTFETHSKFASPVVQRKAPSLVPSPPPPSLDARPPFASAHPALDSLASSASQQADTLQQRLAEEHHQHLQRLEERCSSAISPGLPPSFTALLDQNLHPSAASSIVPAPLFPHNVDLSLPSVLTSFYHSHHISASELLFHQQQAEIEMFSQHQYLQHRQTLRLALQEAHAAQHIPPQTLHLSHLHDVSQPHPGASPLYAFPSLAPFPASPVAILAPPGAQKYFYHLSNGLTISARDYELDVERRQVVQAQAQLLYVHNSHQHHPHHQQPFQPHPIQPQQPHPQPSYLPPPLSTDPNPQSTSTFVDLPGTSQAAPSPNPSASPSLPTEKLDSKPQAKPRPNALSSFDRRPSLDRRHSDDPSPPIPTGPRAMKGAKKAKKQSLYGGMDKIAAKSKSTQSATSTESSLLPISSSSSSNSTAATAASVTASNRPKPSVSSSRPLSMGSSLPKAASALR